MFFYKTINKYFLIVATLFFFLINSSLAQDLNIQEYQFISPLPGSSMILPENNIIIREGNLIDESTIYGENRIEVTGSKSGRHTGKLILSDDQRTLIFKPDRDYYQGENVYIKLNNGIKTIDKENLLPLEFHFRTCEKVSKEYTQNEMKRMLEENQCEQEDFSSSNKNSSSKENLMLQKYFPPITVNVSNNPTPGYLFISPFSSTYTFNYRMILDNNGIPIYFSTAANVQDDFKVQPNGLLTYYDWASLKFKAMDSSYAVFDSFACGNGYTTNNHELLVFTNGHSYLMAYDWQHVRMDTIVQGGDSTAIVIGLIIQELDAAKNVVFQWRSWDNFQITDATEDIDLTAHTIDYVHGNAIELDYDGNLLISSRHLDEITKINRQTGEIIWRLGGLKSKNNQFQFIGDPRTFSHQHDIRRLANGNITLFDNGNLHSPSYSRGLEYHLDEVTKTATLVWEFHNEPPTFYFAMGSTRNLSSNNTLIGWGWGTADSRVLTEVTKDGSIAFELSMPDSFANYRAFRFPWKTNLFVTNPDSIFFESIPIGDSATTTIHLVSNSSEEINITGFYNRYNSYIIEHTIPFILPPFGSEPIEIKFKPVEEGYIKDTLHIRSDTDTSRIAQILVLAGRTDTSFSGINDPSMVTEYRLEQNYPNPFNPVTTINFAIPQKEIVTIQLYDLLGNEVETLLNKELNRGEHSLKFNAVKLTSGIYFYRIVAGKFSEIKKMLYLK